MKVIDWVDWDDDYKENETLTREEAVQVAAEGMRAGGYHFSGEYHQNYPHGTPLLDDGTVLRFSFRTWGSVMVAAYPDEIDNSDGLGYCVWAWDGEDNDTRTVLPYGKGDI